jgi:hypothetical protein
MFVFLELQPHFHGDVPAWFGYVDEAVIAGMVVVAAVEQVVGV